MAISSMTGFASSQGSRGDSAWVWEAKSVNGRGFDLRLRLPAGLEHLDIPLRDVASKQLSRGSVTIALTFDRAESGMRLQVNEVLLADVLTAEARVRALSRAAVPDTMSILAFKGVLEVSETRAGTNEGRDGALIASFEEAIAGLVGSRRSEGAKLAAILSNQINEIERLVTNVAGSPSRSAEAIKLRLKDQIARLIDASDAFDPDRLHQEAVLVATRADVAEELDRLTAHIASAREVIAAGGITGRKLDFLAQEFNREANTLCSKANAVDISRAGLALKTVIDQLREQVQNIE